MPPYSGNILADMIDEERDRQEKLKDEEEISRES